MCETQLAMHSMFIEYAYLAFCWFAHIPSSYLLRMNNSLLVQFFVYIFVNLYLIESFASFIYFTTRRNVLNLCLLKPYWAIKIFTIILNCDWFHFIGSARGESLTRSLIQFSGIWSDSRQKDDPSGSKRAFNHFLLLFLLLLRGKNLLRSKNLQSVQ